MEKSRSKSVLTMESGGIAENPWGISCSIDIYNCNPASIRSAAVIQDYTIKLCKLIEMERYGDVQIVHFGTGNKEGFTLIQLIETSNITGHFSNDKNAAYIDIFSCKMFCPEQVAKFTQEFFEGDKAVSSWSYRE